MPNPPARYSDPDLCRSEFMPSKPPRQILKDILQGTRPERPLFLPIVFSLGARVENTTLRDYLYNPTRICKALRQIRGYLPADGVTCYFDSTVEAEALGAKLQWNTNSGMPAAYWPGPGGPGTSQASLPRVEDVVEKGRIQIACEVIRRLKSAPAEDRLFMAGVTGLFSVASHLVGHGAQSWKCDLSSAVFEFASSLITRVATMYVESGANVIFFVENALPSLSADQYRQWASLLEPASNIVRFYGALPVLLLADAGSAAAASAPLFTSDWDCVLCPNVRDLCCRIAPPLNGLTGMASPLELFSRGAPQAAASITHTRELLSAFQPVTVTTAGDLPMAVDLKVASRMLSGLRQLF